MREKYYLCSANATTDTPAGVSHNRITNNQKPHAHTVELSPLTAISPVDGRYRNKTQSLDAYFSEYALIRYRIRVEIEYFIALCELPLPQLEAFPHNLFPKLRAIYEDFSLADASRVKEIEAVTNHDVKAVEYFIKERFRTLDATAQSERAIEFIHFGLTSQDINNTAVPLSCCYASTSSSTVLPRNGAEWPCWQRHTGSRHRQHVWARS